eukprot:1351766-Amorphochlora_amoeboformis.AAC.1
MNRNPRHLDARTPIAERLRMQATGISGRKTAPQRQRRRLPQPVPGAVAEQVHNRDRDRGGGRSRMWEGENRASMRGNDDAGSSCVYDP